jgi:hypothetical protein
MKFMKLNTALVGILGGLAALSAGCGKQAFQVAASSEQQQAPGIFNVPARVDILLVEDDTGSMRETFSQIAAQMPAFLEDLRSRGWDYHFATAPLTTLRPIGQVAASQYDINWGTQWTAPFPGATMTNLRGQVSSSAFRFPSTYNAFLSGNELSNTTGEEPGLKNIVAQLQDTSITSTGFLRDDALLAIVMVGNGDDTSYLNKCKWNETAGYGDTVVVVEGLCKNAPTVGRTNSERALYDSYRAKCGSPGAAPAGSCNNDADSFNSLKNQILAIKSPDLNTAAAKTRFFAAVDLKPSSNYYGKRYVQMAGALGGVAYDIIYSPVHQILDSLAGNLQSVQMSMRTRYLVISEQPNPASVKVYRHPGGNESQRIEIPRDANNGWTPAGATVGSPNEFRISNFYVIDYPALLNFVSTGYAVELHGSAKITGGDTATVEFTPVGVQDTVSK